MESPKRRALARSTLLASLFLPFIPQALLAYGEWSLEAATPTRRVGGLAACIDGVIYVFKDELQCAGATGFRTVDAFDTRTGLWRAVTPLPEARWVFMVATDGQVIYVLGGETMATRTPNTWKYDPALEGTPQGPWDTSLPPPPKLLALSGAAFVGGKAYLIAGRTAANTTPCVFAAWEVLDETWVFDPSDGSWSTRSAIPGGPIDNVAACVREGKILVLGGGAPGAIRGSFREYDPVADSWTALPPYPGPIMGPAVGVLEGALVAAGGVPDAYDTPGTDASWWFDFASGVWRALPPLPCPTSAAAHAVCDGALYSIGGIHTATSPVFCTQAFRPRPMLAVPAMSPVDCSEVIPVTLSSLSSGKAFSLSLDHSPDIGRLVSIELGSVFQAIGAPDVLEVRQGLAGCEAGFTGLTLAVLVSLDGSREIPPGENEVARLVFRRESSDRAKTCASSPLRFRSHCYGSPPVRLVVVGPQGDADPLVRDGLLVPSGSCFLRGDADVNTRVTIGDPVAVIAHLFLSRPLVCLDAGDFDDDGDGPDLVDAVGIINYLFRSGPAPSTPFPASGADPTADSLTCEPCV